MGYIVCKGDQVIGSDSGLLLGVEVCDAEDSGAQKALEGAMGKAGDCPIKGLLDNSTAVRALRTGQTKSSQAAVEIFTRLARQARSVEIRWIPAHAGIMGNEDADRLAKDAFRNFSAKIDAATSEKRCEVKYKFAALTRLVRQKCGKAVKSWMLEHRSSRYEELDLRMKRKCPPELVLPR